MSVSASAKMMSKRWLFIGPPGVGKGTYASRVAMSTGLAHFSSGDMLRAEVKEGTPFGKELGKIIDRGDFVSTDHITELIAANVDRLHAKNPGAGYILDGFPRSLEQAKAVDDATKAGSFVGVDHVIAFHQPYEVILEKMSSRRCCVRCGMVYNYAQIDCAGIKMDPLVPKEEGKCDKCGCTEPLETRTDDKREVVQHRLDVYRELTEPLEEYYMAHDKMVQFDVLGGAKQFTPKLLDLMHSF